MDGQDLYEWISQVMVPNLSLQDTNFFFFRRAGNFGVEDKRREEDFEHMLAGTHS
jgi:hypothetical protein